MTQDDADADMLRTCTRPEDHDGPHVACGLFSHDLERWEA